MLFFFRPIFPPWFLIIGLGCAFFQLFYLFQLIDFAAFFLFHLVSDPNGDLAGPAAAPDGGILLDDGLWSLVGHRFYAHGAGLNRGFPADFR